MSGKEPDEELAAAATSFPISRKRQVSWFDTRQLLATGSQAVAAGVVGSMSGRRELMAALDPGPGTAFETWCDADELWIDYIADTGDGWNATCSVMWLAGRDGLLLNLDRSPKEQTIPASCHGEAELHPESGQVLLPSGKMLILGGDQVYPTASPTAYQQRLSDPMRCARSYEKGGRELFAIPGNHDWYDGLTTFIRLFCQTGDSRRWFGCWRAQQRRSYFSARLPHGWWLWGLDTALEDDLDPPQYDYFRKQAKKLKDGDRLILVVPAPTWLGYKPRVGQCRSVDKLKLIMDVPAECGRKVEYPLVLTGDRHFYAHHEVQLEDARKRHYVVCGGGGAFGLGTLQVPDRIDVSEESSSAGCTTFPDRRQSVRLRRGVLSFPFQNWAFTSLLAAAGFLTLWLLSAVSPSSGHILSSSSRDGIQAIGWIDRLASSETSLAGLCRSVAAAGSLALRSPALMLWLLLFAGIVLAFARSGASGDGARWRWWLAGASHALLQLVGALVCVWIASKVIGEGTTADAGAIVPLKQWLVLGFSAPLLYLYGGGLFGLYLLASHKVLGMHDQEVFSAQAIEDYKSFLRMRICSDGLEVYPIGLTRCAKRWKAAPGVSLTPPDINIFSKDQLVTVPIGCLRAMDPCEPLRPHLIEEPIRIAISRSEPRPTSA